MNVPNLKVTLFLSDIFGVGWQESHYRTDAFNPATPLNTYEPLGIELAKNRAAALHAAYYRLTDVRLSYDNVFRDSYLVKSANIPQIMGTGANAKYDGGVSGSGSTYQTVQSAVPMVLSMRDFKKRAISYLSGFRDNVAQHIRGTNSSPADFLTFQTYGRYLCNLDATDNPRSSPSLWGTKLVVPEDPVGTVLPTLPVTKVSYVPIVGGKGMVIHINVAAGLDSHFAVGNTVYLAGWKIFTPQPRVRINGNYEVINTGMDGPPINQPFIEVVKSTMFVQPSTTAPGTIQGSRAWVFPYQNYSFRNATHHKRGKPSFEPRGRR